MASGQTTNYNLNQWEAGDQILREEFNADNAKIDAAIPKIVTGTYTGDGATNRLIVLGFRPRAVLLFHENGSTCYYNSALNYYSCFGGLLLDGRPLRFNNEFCNVVCAEIKDTGFTVTVYLDRSQFANVATNTANNIYHYIAIR